MGDFGDVIKTARKKRELSQEALGMKVGVTKNAIYDWEKERYLPTNAANISALERALDFESGYLYKLLYSNPPLPSTMRN